MSPHPPHMKIKVIPEISAIKNSDHDQVFKPSKKQSMNVQSVHVMHDECFKKQDGRSRFQSIRNPTSKKFDQSENDN